MKLFVVKHCYYFIFILVGSARLFLTRARFGTDPMYRVPIEHNLGRWIRHSNRSGERARLSQRSVEPSTKKRLLKNNSKKPISNTRDTCSVARFFSFTFLFFHSHPSIMYSNDSRPLYSRVQRYTTILSLPSSNASLSSPVSNVCFHGILEKGFVFVLTIITTFFNSK